MAQESSSEEAASSRITVAQAENAVEEVSLNDYPYLLAASEISLFLVNESIRKALIRLGPEKLKAMNEKWMLLKGEEVELNIRKAQLDGKKKEELRLIKQEEAKLYLKRIQLCEKHLDIVQKEFMKSLE
ncbi:uncharacterized protein LOC132054678 [Lycium ferocissimum]|uniref:uncharacterized protein LOC132054678 n=1 Tax=Lycium ferocissimum TaxID=112874 RepID=UPI0028155F36|nr:uncharacterized protein LOC132054678 [Lycium ferocissimum]